MTEKKARISSKLIQSSIGSVNKPSTVTRAAITAEIKPSRGKQLVEHNPFSLIPDPANPRPGEIIDDTWLIRELKLGTEASLCYYDDASGDYYIPEFSALDIVGNEDLRSSYDFLRNLAISIRNDGLIEPIEIFLADRNNDPEYFEQSSLDYGYVVLEGHQRRLAGMIAGVKTVTCIEITDETMLAKLKVKHRKLRRQLSENNLRKGLSVAQNFLIVRELLKSDGAIDISVKELSSIIGLNAEIASALRRLCLNENNYPNEMLELILDNRVSFKWIRFWISKTPEQLGEEIQRLLSGQNISFELTTKKSPEPVARGRSGGAVKRTAIFKVKDENDTLMFQRFLLSRFPELRFESLGASPFSDLEKILEQLLAMALERPSDPGRILYNYMK